MKLRTLRFVACAFYIFNLETMWNPLSANTLARYGRRVVPSLSLVKHHFSHSHPALGANLENNARFYSDSNTDSNKIAPLFTNSPRALSGTQDRLGFRGVRDYHVKVGSNKSVSSNSYFVDSSTKDAIVKNLELACESDDDLYQQSQEFHDSIDLKNAKIVGHLLKYRDDQDKYTSALEALRKHAILKEVEKIPNANLLLFENYLGALNPNSPYTDLSVEDKRMIHQGGIIFNDTMKMIDFSLQRTGYYTSEEIGKELEKIAKDSAEILANQNSDTGKISDVVLLSYHLDKEMDQALSSHEIATNVLCLGFISSFMAWNFVPGVNEAVVATIPTLAAQAWDVVEGPLTFSMFVKMIYDSKTRRVGTFYKHKRAQGVMRTLVPKEK